MKHIKLSAPLSFQATIGVSKIVSALLGKSDSNLRRSLTSIASYVGQDEKVQVSIKAVFSNWSFIIFSAVQVHFPVAANCKLAVLLLELVCLPVLLKPVFCLPSSRTHPSRPR